MSAWKKKAIELFPNLKSDIEISDSVTEVWWLIGEKLIEAFSTNNLSYIKSVKQYIAWCSNSGNDSAYQALHCGFYEDLGTNKLFWPYIHQLINQQQFEKLKNLWKHCLSEDKINEIEGIFNDR